MSDVPCSSIDLLSPRSFIEQKIDEIKVNNLQFKMRNIDGYVHVTTLCTKFGKDFNRFWVLESRKKLVTAIAREMRIPVVTETTSSISNSCGIKICSHLDGECCPLCNGNCDPKLGALHYVIHGKNEARGYWAHPRVALEVIKWISLEFEVLANGILHRYFTGQITAEESQAVSQNLFAIKGPMKAICDQALTVIYIGIYGVDQLKYGISSKPINQRHDAAHTRSYEQIPIMIVLSRADATPVETALERYLNKYNLKTGSEEHFYRDRVQQHFGFPDVEAHHIIVSLLLHADAAPMVVLDPLNRNAVMTAPKDYKEYCDIDENKIIDFKTILEECEKSNNKRKQPSKIAIEQESKRFKEEKDHELCMTRIEEDKHIRDTGLKRMELENQRLALEIENQKHARELEAQDKRLALEREAEDKKQMIYYELELKKLNFEREKWMAQNSIGNTTAPNPCLPSTTNRSPQKSSPQKIAPKQTLTTPRRQQLLPSTPEDIKYRNFVRQIHLDIKGHGEWAEKFYTFGEVPNKLIYPGENSSDTVFIAARSLNMCVFCRGRYLGGERLNAHVKDCDRRPNEMKVQFMQADWMHCPFANDPFE